MRYESTVKRMLHEASKAKVEAELRAFRAEKEAEKLAKKSKQEQSKLEETCFHNRIPRTYIILLFRIYP